MTRKTRRRRRARRAARARARLTSPRRNPERETAARRRRRRAENPVARAGATGAARSKQERNELEPAAVKGWFVLVLRKDGGLLTKFYFNLHQ